jgi:hypothetical protein
MKGKKMPQIGVVDISVMEEGQSRWLAFQDGQLDYREHPAGVHAEGAGRRQLAPDLVKQGFRLQRVIDPDLTYTAFNFKDPGRRRFSKEKTALRRAIVMAFDTERRSRSCGAGRRSRRRRRFRRASSATTRNTVADQVRPALANKLLDQFGYSAGPTAMRNAADGKPLLLKMSTETNAIDRDFNELWRKSMDRIGIRIDFVAQKFSENYRAAKACQLMLWGQAWIADYPDGENSCSCSTGRIQDRTTTAATRAPLSTSCSWPQRGCPIRPNAIACTNRWGGRWKSMLPGDWECTGFATRSFARWSKATRSTRCSCTSSSTWISSDDCGGGVAPSRTPRRPGRWQSPRRSMDVDKRCYIPRFSELAEAKKIEQRSGG